MSRGCLMLALPNKPNALEHEGNRGQSRPERRLVVVIRLGW